VKKKSKSRLKKFVLTAGYKYESPYSGYSHEESSGPHTVMAINLEKAEEKVKKICREQNWCIEYFTWFRDEAEMAVYEENFLY
jgi:hypothetical protein